MRRDSTFNYEDLLEHMMMLEKMPRFTMPLPFMPPPLGTFTYGQEKSYPDISSILAMVKSMTTAERSLAVPLDENRKNRIARGSGTSIDSVRALERQLLLSRQEIRPR